MDHHLSDRINRLSESQTIAMAKLSRALTAEGHDMINLSLGEPDFATPLHIKNAAKQAIDEGYTYYTPVPGYPELRQAICEKLKRDNGLDYKLNEVMVSTGAKQCIANVMLCLLNTGDEVILPAPYWVSYLEIVKLAEAAPKILPTTIDSNFKISAGQLENAITDKTKIFCFSSPCNPTGTVYSKKELKAFAEVLLRHEHVYVISDEIYEYINFTGKHESIASFPELKERVITVNGLSKGFAMTGWRIGYMAAPEWITHACDKMQGQITSGTCSIAQRAAIEALTGDMAPTYQMKEAFLRRRDIVLYQIKEIPGIKPNAPEGAFYVFPDVSHYFGKSYDGRTIQTNDDFCMYLLKEAKVSIVTGKAFGDANCVRISYAASEEKLREAMKRIKEALAKLK